MATPAIQSLPLPVPIKFNNNRINRNEMLLRPIRFCGRQWVWIKHIE